MTSRMMAALILVSLTAGVASDAHARSQNELIGQRVLPHLEHLFQRVVTEKRDTGTRIQFGAGDVTELHIEGLQTCDAQPVAADSVYTASHGPMKTGVRCYSDKLTLDKPMTITWTMRYR